MYQNVKLCSESVDSRQSASLRGTDIEPFYSVRKAAGLLGIKYHALLGAVRDGTVPSYRPFNSRRLVRISEIEVVIRAYESSSR